MRRVLGTTAAMAVALTVAPVVIDTPVASAVFPGCAAPTAGSMNLTIGEVACQQIDSETVGGTTAFSYYVPEACDPQDHPDRTCPVLYLLHGFGGDWESETGTAGGPSAKIEALTKAPPVDPHEVADPWSYSDPDGWTDAPDLDFIVIGPHGRTVEGGFGPAPDLDGFWMNWNPRYSSGGDKEGDQPQYDTPAPRFEDFVTEELAEYVEEQIGTAGDDREWRAVQGTSLGGYGAYLLGLRHPDLYATVGSVSGAHNFLFTPGIDPVDATSPVGIGPPVRMPYVQVPGAGPAAVPLEQLPAQARGFATALYALGDPAADGALYRGHMPRDLAMNARAWDADGEQSVHLRAFVNDAVPRRADDFSDPPGSFGAQAFEAIVLEMNATMEAAFTTQGVERTFHLHPGLHSGAYWNPFLRDHMEEQYERVRHRDGGSGRSAVPERPEVFDYRTVDREFSIWGWDFSVERPNVEFLHLTDVSCESITLRGTGTVTFTVPAWCGGGTPESRTETIELGHAFPVDEPGGAGGVPASGTTRTIDLTG